MGRVPPSPSRHQVWWRGTRVLLCQGRPHLSTCPPCIAFHKHDNCIALTAPPVQGWGSLGRGRGGGGDVGSVSAHGVCATAHPQGTLGVPEWAHTSCHAKALLTSPLPHGINHTPDSGQVSGGQRLPPVWWAAEAGGGHKLCVGGGGRDVGGWGAGGKGVNPGAGWECVGGSVWVGVCGWECVCV
jgi:hypothetical protein